MWLVSIKRSFQGLFVAIETMRIVEELMEIWPNEVCDTHSMFITLYENKLIPWGRNTIVYTQVLLNSSTCFYSTASCEVLSCCCLNNPSLSTSSWLLKVSSMVAIWDWKRFSIYWRYYGSSIQVDMCEGYQDLWYRWAVSRIRSVCHAYNWHSQLIWQITWQQTLWLHLTVVCPWCQLLE